MTKLMRLNSGLAIIFVTDAEATSEVHPPGKFLHTRDIHSLRTAHFLDSWDNLCPLYNKSGLP